MISKIYIPRKNILASYSLKFVLLISLFIAIYKSELLWIIGSLIGLGIEIIPNLLKRDIEIVLPWPIEFLIAAVIGLNMVGVLLNIYYKIPGFSEITHFLASILFAFFAFAIIYIIDKHWEGLNMDKYAMAFVVVVTTMAAGVILEFIKYFNLFGKKQYSVEEVLISLFTTMVAGIIMALIGVNLIRGGEFDRVTNDIAHSVDKKFLQKMKRNNP